MDDRREHFRFPSGGLKVNVNVLDRATFAQQYLNNISRGGCFIESSADLTSGEHVRVVFEIATKVRVELDGEVTHVSEHEPRGFGVRFMDVPPERLSDLDSFIAGVLGEIGQRAAKRPTREIPAEAVAELRRQLEEPEPEPEPDLGAGLDVAIVTDSPRSNPSGTELPLGEGEDYDEFTVMEVDLEVPADAFGGFDFEEDTIMGTRRELADKDAGVAAEMLGLSSAVSSAVGSAPRQSAPGLTPDMERFLAGMELRLGGDSAYQALGVSPADDSDTIAVNVAGDLEQLDALGGHDDLLERVTKIRSGIELAWSYISDPRARAALDLSMGYFPTGNRSPQERAALQAAAEALRAPYAREHPDEIQDAELLELTAQQQLATGDLTAALDSARQAVELDPYNLQLRSVLQEIEFAI